MGVSIKDACPVRHQHWSIRVLLTLILLTLTGACTKNQSAKKESHDNSALTKMFGFSSLSSSSHDQNTTVYFSTPLFDSTGQSFSEQTLTVKEPKEGESYYAFNGHAVTDEMVAERQSLGVVGYNTSDQAVGDGIESDADGVIVMFKGASALEKLKELKERGFSNAQAQAAVEQALQRLSTHHAQMATKIQQKIGRSVQVGGKRAPGKMRLEFMKKAINAAVIEGISVNEAKEKLSSLSDVKSVHPNYKMRAGLLDSVKEISADQVWPLLVEGTEVRGQGIRIGIIDTGVDYTHPDLGGCLGASCKVAGGYDFVNNDADPIDDHGHGTHVAATAAGRGRFLDSSGTYGSLPGVAPEAEIYAYKVLSAYGSGTSSNVIKAIEACADPNNDGDFSDHLDICNLSLGGPGTPDDPTSVAVDNGTAAGVVYAIAAGNSGPGQGTIGSPGAARSAITVAAACKSKDVGTTSYCEGPIAQFSSRGPVQWTDASGTTQTLQKPDIAAPGVAICAAQWGDAWASRACLDDSHVAISGTSMATPHVAGLAALLLQAYPHLTPEEVKSMLMKGATDLGVETYSQGAGLANIYRSMELLGLPNSSIKLSGTPIHFVSRPTQTYNQFSHTIGVTNLSGQSQTYSIRFASNSSGLSGSVDKTTLTLDNNASASITLNMKVDHSLAASSSSLEGVIILSSATEEFRVSAIVDVGERSSWSPDEIDLGISPATQSDVNLSGTVEVNNLMQDLGDTLQAEVVCCTVGSGYSSGSSFTASLDKATLSLAPGGSNTLTVNVTGTDVRPSSYRGYIHLFSELQDIKIPFVFAKGTLLRVKYADAVPGGFIRAWYDARIASRTELRLKNLLVDQSTPVGGTQEFLLFDVLGSTIDVALQYYYDCPTGTTCRRTWLSYRDLDASTGIVEVTAQINDAIHAVTMDFTPPESSSLSSYPKAAYDVDLEPKNDLWRGGAGVGFMGTSPATIYINETPSTYSLRLTASMKTSGTGEIHLFQYAFNDGINGDITETSTTSRFVEKEVRPAVHQDYGVLPMLLTRNSFWGSIGSTEFSPGSSVRLFVKNNGNKVINSTPQSDFDAFTLFIDANDEGLAQHVLFESAKMLMDQSNEMAWYDPTSKYRWITSSKPLLPNFPEDGTLPLGLGIAFDSSKWLNYGNQIPQHSPSYGMYERFLNITRSRFYVNRVMPMHLWSGYGFQSGMPGKHGPTYETPYNDVNYRMLRDGAVVSEGTMTTRDWLHGSSGFGRVADILRAEAGGNHVYPGNYHFEVSRPVVISGVTTQVSTVTEFQITEATDIDENPPFIRYMQVQADGLMQTGLKSGSTNSLDMLLSPGPGFLNFDGTSLMPDGFSEVLLEVSQDGGATWSSQPLSQNSGWYQAFITPDGSTQLYDFRLKATDLQGNLLQYNFQIPVVVGDGSPPTDDPPSDSDTTAPKVAIQSPTDSSTVSGSLAIAVDATDDVGVTKVEFYINGQLLGSDSISPYEQVWDSSLTANGAATIEARAYDSSGNIGTHTISVTVDNQVNTPPEVSITSPGDHETISGTTTVTVSATDDGNVTKVELFFDGELVGTDTESPYSFSLDTTQFADGSHYLAARAYDDSGLHSNANAVKVMVDNSTNEPPAKLSLSVISPAQVQGGQTVDVTINGTGISKGAQVSLQGGGGPSPDVVVLSVAADGTSLMARISTKSGGPPHKSKRMWDVVVTLPDGQSATLNKAFYIAP